MGSCSPVFVDFLDVLQHFCSDELVVGEAESAASHTRRRAVFQIGALITNRSYEWMRTAMEASRQTYRKDVQSWKERRCTCTLYFEQSLKITDFNW